MIFDPDFVPACPDRRSAIIRVAAVLLVVLALAWLLA